MNVDSAAIARIGVAPDLLRELLAAHDLLGVRGEHGEQAELGRREQQHLTAERRPSARRLEEQLADAELGDVRCR